MPERSVSRRFLAAAAAFLLAAAGSAAAATHYLPLAVSQTTNGKQLRSLLWITNGGSQPAEVRVRFIPTMTDGAAAVGQGVQVVQVQPGASVPVAAAGGGVGMLEVSASAGQLDFAGELNTFAGNGQRRSAAGMPLVGAGDVVPAGGTVRLLALERQPGAAETDLGLLNLGSEEGSCTIHAFRVDGSRIRSAATVWMPALGHREFLDAFGILGEGGLDGARFDVTCDQPFWAYAVVQGLAPDSTQFVVPAAHLADGLADAVADPGLLRQGTFFTATEAEGELRIRLPLDAGVAYRSVEVEVDFALGNLPTIYYTSTLQVRRNGKGGPLYWAHTIRGGDRMKSVLDMGAEKIYGGKNGIWQEQASHRLLARYDTVAKTLVFEVRRGGALVERLQAPAAHLDLRHGGEGIDLVFGQAKVFTNAFYPPFGSRFSNLRVKVEPKG
jgi:hypothetical protein